MIPKRIHYCWISGDPYPPLIAQCIESWHTYLPDYEYILWDTAKIMSSGILSCTWVKEAYNLNRKGSVADYVRLYSLYTEGGVYFDTDVEAVKDISPLLEDPSFIGYETKGDFEAAIMGAEAGTAWIRKCLEYYHECHFCNSDGNLIDFAPMPTKLCKILYTNYSIPKEIKKPIKIADAGLTLYPCDYFSPKNFHTEKIRSTKNTYTIHHFNSHWTKKNVMFYVKIIIHRFIIFIFGQKIHNFIAEVFQKKIKQVL
jgi:mannosyltransferase OCH1-like enzyme